MFANLYSSTCAESAHVMKKIPETHRNWELSRVKITAERKTVPHSRISTRVTKRNVIYVEVKHCNTTLIYMQGTIITNQWSLFVKKWDITDSIIVKIELLNLAERLEKYKKNQRKNL